MDFEAGVRAVVRCWDWEEERGRKRYICIGDNIDLKVFCEMSNKQSISSKAEGERRRSKQAKRSSVSYSFLPKCSSLSSYTHVFCREIKRDKYGMEEGP